MTHIPLKVIKQYQILMKKSHNDEKMYIRAEVELIPEIDDNISLNQWEHLVEMWKKKKL